MNNKATIQVSQKRYGARLMLAIGIMLSTTTLFPSWHSEFNYERSAAFLRNFIHEGDLVFDVGAGRGGKTYLYLMCKAKVVCFEPEIKCLNRLHTRFDHNDDVIIIPKGLAEQSGSRDFFPCNQVTSISSCFSGWTTEGRFVEYGYTWGELVHIDVTTLDTMIERYGLPKFCTIDVEGFESNVLLGLTQPIPCLSFEFTYERKSEAKKCLDYLTQLGYKKFNFVAGESAFFLFDGSMNAETLLEKIYKENVIGVGLWGFIYAFYE